MWAVPEPKQRSSGCASQGKGISTCQLSASFQGWALWWPEPPTLERVAAGLWSPEGRGGGIKALHPSYRDFQLKKKKERERETGRCFPRVLKCCRRCCLPCTPWLLRSPDSVSPAHGSPGVLGPRLRHRQPRGPVAWGSGPRPVVWRLLLGSPFPAV